MLKSVNLTFYKGLGMVWYLFFAIISPLTQCIFVCIKGGNSRRFAIKNRKKKIITPLTRVFFYHFLAIHLAIHLATRPTSYVK